MPDEIKVTAADIGATCDMCTDIHCNRQNFDICRKGQQRAKIIAERMQPEREAAKEIILAAWAILQQGMNLPRATELEKAITAYKATQEEKP